jgi:hypothetical protein
VLYQDEVITLMDTPDKIIITEDLNKISENANVVAQPKAIFAISKNERPSDKKRNKYEKKLEIEKERDDKKVKKLRRLVKKYKGLSFQCSR